MIENKQVSASSGNKLLRLLKRDQHGNIFFTLFGAVAVMGVLGAGVMSFMKGPLQTSIKVTKMNTAESQMQIAAQMAVISGATDCDSDAVIEPLPFNATTPAPTGGGQLPTTMAVNKTDPWGTAYGYCVWNHGTTNSGSCGGSSDRINGLAHATNYTAYPVLAIISAGPNKTFGTTCNSFATADVNADGDLSDAGDLPMAQKGTTSPAGDDDIVFQYTYDEATSAGGGLWALKSTDSSTAYIASSTEVQGNSRVTGTSTFDSAAYMNGGMYVRNITTTSGKININSPWNLISYAAGMEPVCDVNVAGGIIRITDGSRIYYKQCSSGTWQSNTPFYKAPTEWIAASGLDTGDKRIQFNNQGLFGNDDDFTYTSASGLLTVGGVTHTTGTRLDIRGDITYTGTITDVSDMRLKENIRALSHDGQLRKLAALNGYAFSMKGDDTHRMEYGLMAQEVEQVYPELVVEKTMGDQNIKTLNVQGMVAPMLEGIKELKAENDVLRARLEKLERQQQTSP